ncbi:hypothetical protein BCR39DRAFT_551993 [Naematelia encephala]|uniref:Uncharacterized protein n=1 Tax=Naematelia encephala TaxID=71784 RepID=A0A1Y2AI41_9TREE|nr:hypothetical protein BCR39DRAFT_551993 [Naematelia encephala]
MSNLDSLSSSTGLTASTSTTAATIRTGHGGRCVDHLTPMPSFAEILRSSAFNSLWTDVYSMNQGAYISEPVWRGHLQSMCSEITGRFKLNTITSLEWNPEVDLSNALLWVDSDIHQFYVTCRRSVEQKHGRDPNKVKAQSVGVKFVDIALTWKELPNRDSQQSPYSLCFHPIEVKCYKFSTEREAREAKTIPQPADPTSLSLNAAQTIDPPPSETPLRPDVRGSGSLPNPSPTNMPNDDPSSLDGRSSTDSAFTNLASQYVKGLAQAILYTSACFTLSGIPTGMFICGTKFTRLCTVPESDGKLIAVEFAGSDASERRDITISSLVADKGTWSSRFPYDLVSILPCSEDPSHRSHDFEIFVDDLIKARKAIHNLPFGPPPRNLRNSTHIPAPTLSPTLQLSLSEKSELVDLFVAAHPSVFSKSWAEEFKSALASEGSQSSTDKMTLPTEFTEDSSTADHRDRDNDKGHGRQADDDERSGGVGGGGTGFSASKGSNKRRYSGGERGRQTGHSAALFRGDEQQERLDSTRPGGRQKSAHHAPIPIPTENALQSKPRSITPITPESPARGHLDHWLRYQQSSYGLFHPPPPSSFDDLELPSSPTYVEDFPKLYTSGDMKSTARQEARGLLTTQEEDSELDDQETEYPYELAAALFHSHGGRIRIVDSLEMDSLLCESRMLSDQIRHQPLYRP